MATTDSAKRVYFAFHYQDVIDFRANVVRNHNALQGVKKAGYYDHSIWEESKKTSDIALKRLINSELDGTSVTAVLIGSDTWARRWVRYEIAKSIARGNYVLGIHINSVNGRDGLTKPLGANPFDNMAIQISADGYTGRFYEWKGAAWVSYDDLDEYSFAKQQSPSMRGKSPTLSYWYKAYDWISDDGYVNFSSWIA